MPKLCVSSPGNLSRWVSTSLLQIQKKTTGGIGTAKRIHMSRRGGMFVSKVDRLISVHVLNSYKSGDILGNHLGMVVACTRYPREPIGPARSQIKQSRVVECPHGQKKKELNKPAPSVKMSTHKPRFIRPSAEKKPD